jgi:chaperonin GroEL
MISEDLGVKLENVTIDYLGMAKKVRLTKDDTTIIDGAGDKAGIGARTEQLRAQIEEAASDYDKEKLQERLAKLAGGVAIIRVGGITEIEVKERKDRVEDAMHATRAAIEEGIVAGGGVTLLYTARAIGGLTSTNADQLAGIDIVRKALRAPVRQIADNAGADGVVVVGKLLDSNDIDFGYDAQNDVFTDMVKSGIVDPVKVVRIALQDAASIAGLIITTEATVALRDEEMAAAVG